MPFPASLSASLDERVAALEAEVARLSLFITLFQESKILKLDVSKFPLGEAKKVAKEAETKYEGLFSDHHIDVSKYSLN